MSKRKKPNTGRQSRSSPDGATQGKGQRRWYRADLHIHTPGSNDYEEPKATYLDVLRTAAERDLDIIAVTDHNTVAGIGAIRREIEWLTRLESDKRLTDEERARLTEWRDLSERVLVLPGFEFTATFGFHILGIFPPETPLRKLEHILLSLNIPVDKLDIGSTETGSATDVLTAYKVIHEAGGLVIAAHANSTHGVAMRNFPFGGQTKIAYTQDPNLDALEVTDLDKSYRSTARFFNGSKSEYPRRMHCIQGSDAHRLTSDPKNPRRLGVGERATEFLLDDASFEAIVTVLRSKQFDRTRPARPADKPFDSIAAAREEGPSLIQSFHESASQRGGRLTTIINDLCAFANTSGGSVYVGVGQRKGPPKGLTNAKQVQSQIEHAVDERITPPLEPAFDLVETEGVKVLRIQVSKGKDRPYCVDDHKFYVRDEGETNMAVRDEIVSLVLVAQDDEPESAAKVTAGSGSGSSKRKRRRGGRSRSGGDKSKSGSDGKESSGGSGVTSDAAASPERDDTFYLPQIGVEIVNTEERNGHLYHTICDLRNGNTINNVTRKGARKLWNYAIQQHEDHPVDPKKVEWHDNVGIVNSERRAGKVRYDLALRENGDVRIFYGVTEDGMEGKWAVFVKDE
ncbi:MAG: putative DNA binding domain-containing protein [Caldilineaceae bacterium]